MNIVRGLFLVTMIFFSFNVFADDIKIHAPFNLSFSCTEHWEGQFKMFGDALGTDCVINGWYKDDKRLFQRRYQNQGFENKDWFGFQKALLAPCNCTVSKIYLNEVTNKPGIINPGRASSIVFTKKDNTSIIYGHVREVAVSVGEVVKSGQVVAKVGNNGYSRNPHLHIGAWNSKQIPLQIQFDQATLNKKKPTQ